MAAPEWQIWIDTGGTFTDCLARGPRGELRRVKVLSSSALRGRIAGRLDERRVRVRVGWGAPDDFIRGFRFYLMGLEHRPPRVRAYAAAEGEIEVEGALPPALEAGMPFEVRAGEEAPILAARLATGTPAGRPLPAMAMRLATTRGTNALLERRGAKAALFITRGFGDLLRIGTQQRPDLFALDIRKPRPLYAAVVEVDERLDAAGGVLRELECAALEARARALVRQGVETAAVALMHSYRRAEHELRLAEFLRHCGFGYVACSAELAPSIKLLSRARTAVVEAYLEPVIGAYLERVRRALGGGALHLLTSAGGLVRADFFRAKDSLLSGPAGGVAGAALAGRRAGFDKIISFDMGGTSTDVARCDGDFEYLFEHRVGDAHLVAPALAIETVAAGGGSICRLEEGRLRVGPQSAGAQPGPACYGAGGPLTLTDVNLLLGRLDAARFEIPIAPRKARQRLEEICRRLREESGEQVRPEEVLEGFVEIADERMAAAIRRISLGRGYDPAEYALVAFGGAGAQHACGVAARLGMDTVLVPAGAGLLSALGLGHAPVERLAERQVLAPLAEVEERIGAWLAQLGREAAERVREEGIAAAEITVRRRLVDLRFAGQDPTLSVEWEEGTRLGAAFARAYRRRYGHWPQGRAIEVESLRAVASSPPPGAQEPGEIPAGRVRPPGVARVWERGAWHRVPVYERAHLEKGARLEGPALVFERHSAAFVPQGWELKVEGRTTLVLERRPGAAAWGRRPQPEAVRLELFTHALESMAREMGAMVRRTALSTNVKERLDFSCALLDAGGRLVVNAPHIPVHLGALGLCVRRARAAVSMGPGDTIVTNHPGFGGSHLPDITLITPVHGDSGRLLGYAATRAHHAEIGGVRPGSMPPAATCLAQEGVVIAPRHLVRGGRADWEGMRALLQEAPYPSRRPADNIADLEAALAANHRGCTALGALARRHGEESVLHYMAALRALARRGVQQALGRRPDGCYTAREELDDGSPLQVRIDLRGERARVDFSGSAPVHPGNLNATPAIVRSVLVYVLRLLVERPLPLNEGLMEAVEVHLPPGMLNPDFPADPARAPAVVGGNVETSQRLADTLLKALGLAACSQGTMNNLLFGTGEFGYYETVCGGCGAGEGFAGASAVHSHMTNTRITDVEILEQRYPVRLARFGLRAGSGGEGRWRGGEGVVRELVFLAPMSLSVLSQNRRRGPCGRAGGGPGRPGRQWIVRADGKRVELGAIDGCEVAAGDRLVLETPGGGGWGAPEGDGSP